MKIGVYLGRFPRLGGGIKVYAHEFIRCCQGLFDEIQLDDEIVFYGDNSVWDQEILSELSNLSSNGKTAKSKFSICANIHARNLCISRFRHFGYIFDQFLLPCYFKKDGLDILLSVTNTGFVFLGKHQIVTVHDLFQAWPPESLEGCGSYATSERSKGFCITRMLYRALFKLQFRFCNSFIVDSSQVADEIKIRYQVPEEAISIVPLGIDGKFAEVLGQMQNDQADFAAQERDWLSRRGLSSGYICLLASSDPRKNVMRILRAWSRLPQPIKTHRLVVVLSDPNVKPMIDSFFASDKDEFKNITVMSRLPREEMPYLFSSSRLLAYPTLAEGFGLPVIEGACLGTHVVSSQLELLNWSPELSDRVFVADPFSEDDIVRAIEDAWNSRSVSNEGELVKLPVLPLRTMKEAISESLKIAVKVAAGREFIPNGR